MFVFLSFFPLTFYEKNLIARRADFDCFLIQFASLSFPSFPIPVLELYRRRERERVSSFCIFRTCSSSSSLSLSLFLFYIFFATHIDWFRSRFLPFCSIPSLLMVISPLRHSRPNIHGPRRRRTRSSSQNRNQGAAAAPGCTSLRTRKKSNIQKKRSRERESFIALSVSL